MERIIELMNHWNIGSKLDWAAEHKREKLISFSGDPGELGCLTVGIGKSTVFGAIVHFLNKRDTRKKLKDKFPFFSQSSQSPFMVRRFSFATQ